MSISEIVYIMIAQYWLASEWRLFPVWGFRRPAIPGVAGTDWPCRRRRRWRAILTERSCSTKFTRITYAPHAQKGVSPPRVLFHHVPAQCADPHPDQCDRSAAIPLQLARLLLESFLSASPAWVDCSSPPPSPTGMKTSFFARDIHRGNTVRPGKHRHGYCLYVGRSPDTVTMR